MFDLYLDPRRPRRLVIGGAPEGHDARILAAIAKRLETVPLLHVALDDSRAERLSELLAFFDPEIEVVILPAWDCLPYDRVSPNAGIVARRVDALSRVLAPATGARIVIATVNGVSQRLPPRTMLQMSSFLAAEGEALDIEALQSFLAGNGYTRSQTVREPGEFAVRGGIVDLFPPGAEEPLRLDLFGDEIEQIRRFDPVSQRTTGSVERFHLKPMSELLLDEASIARFRAGYRQAFGAVNDEDPLYESVSNGRRYAGMEHWLPLFHDHLETLFDYLPESPVTLDPEAGHARATREAQVQDFFDARVTLASAEKKARMPLYKPLPPDMLYLDGAEWEAALESRAVAELSPFAPAEGAKDAVDALGRGSLDFAEARTNPEINLYDAVRTRAAALRLEGRAVLIAGYTTGARDRLAALLRDQGRADVKPVQSAGEVSALAKGALAGAVLPIEAGFAAPDLAVITETDILGDRLTRRPRRRRRADQFISEVSALSEGDLVVHADHGVGRYEGLEILTVSGAPHDCLKLVYADEAKLYLPVENIEVLSRYGSEESAAQLDRLGGGAWQARKAKVKKRLKDMADALMRIAAQRALRTTEPLAPDSGAYQEFAARFPYPETDDQLNAIEDVLADLGSGRAMDRLVCGDVGFGKTEVALRAAFVAAMAGRQVAIVTPTTLLARQHYKGFTERFKGLPLRIAQLSRLIPAKDQKVTKQGLADGSIDIVIGTHALLGKSIRFHDLGLVVVDEEQHFGVKQKERLKELRADAHILTLTATPIPRTLQMALSGVRELSLITTPPIDRLAVRTFVLPFDPVVIREALMREHFRGGQTYYVCPRIEHLEEVAAQLKELAPEIKVVTAHGRMPATQLEEVMTAFYDGQFDVLLCTSIVESGLDVPTANTIILHRADMFGLAQLYQLRGRIGRSKLRGYAYLTYSPEKPLTKSAAQRLQVIETLDTLGAGFTLASHDMDIRGAGNLLGEEQSGHIREVGSELYQQLLEEAVAAARSGGDSESAEKWAPQINLGIPVLIPEEYVPDLQVRLDLYRRIARLENQTESEQLAAELIDRFGPLPEEVENLLTLVSLKRLCLESGIERLEAGPRGAVVAFRNNSFARPDRLVDFIARQAGSLKLRPDHRLVLVQGWAKPEQRVSGVRRFVSSLAEIAA